MADDDSALDEDLFINLKNISPAVETYLYLRTNYFIMMELGGKQEYFDTMYDRLHNAYVLLTEKEQELVGDIPARF